MVGTLYSCIDRHGHLNYETFERYCAFLDDTNPDEDEFEIEMLFPELVGDDSNSDDDEVQGRKRKKWSRYRPKLVHCDGTVTLAHPKTTFWFLVYVSHPDKENARFQRKFRLRFRLPYSQYEKLLARISDVENETSMHFFSKWVRPHPYSKKMPVPISLLLLGSLRYLGRGFTFDDIEECTAISQETHRVFFHQFITYGSSALYKEYVKPPLTAVDAEKHMLEMRLAGFVGCVASTDASHVKIDMCPHNLHQVNKGFKLPFTARTYNLTASHRREVLSSTTGHPARWNDQTLIRFDKFATDLKEGKILQDVEFILLERDLSGNIIEVKYKGAWVMVDNGYLKWPTTIPPFKHSNKLSEIRWSKWVESMRKDVECTFGILKGRWRILKSGIRLHGIEAADKIWLTCCALHNLLLDNDGLNGEWTEGVSLSSDWEGSNGELSEESIQRHVPASLRRLLDPNSELRRNGFDSSESGYGNDRMDTIDDNEGDDDDEEVTGNHMNLDQDGTRHVCSLSRDYFRERLVEHFDILFERHQIIWPQRIAAPVCNL